MTDDFSQVTIQYDGTEFSISCRHRGPIKRLLRLMDYDNYHIEKIIEVLVSQQRQHLHIYVPSQGVVDTIMGKHQNERTY